MSTGVSFAKKAVFFAVSYVFAVLTIVFNNVTVFPTLHAAGGSVFSTALEWIASGFVMISAGIYAYSKAEQRRLVWVIAMLVAIYLTAGLIRGFSFSFLYGLVTAMAIVYITARTGRISYPVFYTWSCFLLWITAGIFAVVAGASSQMKPADGVSLLIKAVAVVALVRTGFLFMKLTRKAASS